MREALLLAAMALSLLIAAPAATPEPPAEAEVPAAITITDDGMSWWEYDTGRRQGNRLFRLTGLAREYRLSLHMDQRLQEDGTWRTVSANVGMPAPCYGNWYHSGFVAVHGNGKPTQEAAPQVEIVETGRQGILDFIWEHALVKTRTRFVLHPGADYLLLEIAWEPQPELQTLTVGFNCYPQGYAPVPASRVRGETLERHMITAEREVQQEQEVELDPATEWWQFHLDATLERAPVYGVGGCALAFLPEDVQQATVRVGSYTVSPRVTPHLEGRRARFALWDFMGTPNAQALPALQEQVDEVRRRMASDPWLPSQIIAFQPREENRRIEALSQALGAGAATRIRALREQVTAVARQRGEFIDDRSFAGEAALRGALRDYRLAYWEAERPARREVRTLLLEGPFAYPWRVGEIAREQWGTGAVMQGGYLWKHWVGHRIGYFPSTLEELLSFDVIVLADCPQDPLTEDKRELIAEFVTRGGGLLLLGGMYTYGAGNWEESPLQALLPVELGGLFDRVPDRSSRSVGLTSAGARRLGRVAAPLGVVPWRHEATPLRGAEVWLQAGNVPLAVYAPAGAGRVLAVLATSLGEAPPGQPPLWESPGWPELITRMLCYLATGTSASR